MKNGEYELIVPPADYPGKRYRNKYAYEHRVVWWQKTGKNPDNYPSSIIHHKNESKRDNNPLNLTKKTISKHISDHHPRVTMRQFNCLNCKKDFERPARGKVYKFCSRKCIGLYGHYKRSKNRNKGSQL